MPILTLEEISYEPEMDVYHMLSLPINSPREAVLAAATQAVQHCHPDHGGDPALARVALAVRKMAATPEYWAAYTARRRAYYRLPWRRLLVRPGGPLLVSPPPPPGPLPAAMPRAGRSRAEAAGEDDATPRLGTTPHHHVVVAVAVAVALAAGYFAAGPGGFWGALLATAVVVAVYRRAQVARTVATSDHARSIGQALALVPGPGQVPDDRAITSAAISALYWRLPCSGQWPSAWGPERVEEIVRAALPAALRRELARYAKSFTREMKRYMDASGLHDHKMVDRPTERHTRDPKTGRFSTKTEVHKIRLTIWRLEHRFPDNTGRAIDFQLVPGHDLANFRPAVTTWSHIAKRIHQGKGLGACSPQPRVPYCLAQAGEKWWAIEPTQPDWILRLVLSAAPPPGSGPPVAPPLEEEETGPELF